METLKHSTVKLKEPSVDEALEQLYSILEDYMSTHTSLTVNSLSKRCNVSEPTLRRIYKKQLKRLPTTSTVLNLLSHISKKKKIADLITAFPGPLISRLETSMSLITERELDETRDLSKQLQNSITYLVYKLAANKCGVTLSKVVELFGSYGEQQIEKLLNENLIKEENGVFKASHPNFFISQEIFTSHFKATADFIKPENLTNSPYKSSQLFYNCSSSINLKAYNAILKLQRNSIQKIAKILGDKESEGNIPVFAIGAIDTLDNESAFEISKK